MKRLKVGLVQQANTPDLQTNLQHLTNSIEACPTAHNS